MSIQHDHTLNPVTALEFFHTSSGLLILAGEGCTLKLFEASTSRLVGRFRVFEDQVIHGITVRHNELWDQHEEALAQDIVIWGGSSLAFLSRNDIAAIRSSNHSENSKDSSPAYGISCTVSDWILDAAICPHGPNECVVITAHNTALRAKTGTWPHFISLEKLNSPPRSILYSAHVIWESEHTVLVAAGTVFGEIIVWQCSVSTPGNLLRYTFTGHEGSIFGINLSPIFSGRDGNRTRLLASCSDDRTVRIWELGLGEEADGRLPEILAAKKTGFGVNEWQGETSSKCLTMVMGHASRIWGVEFLVRGSCVSVLSYGEDATTQHWALEFEQPKLTHLNTFAYNAGKHIFSRATLLDGEGTVVATGGADGKISIFEFRDSASNPGTDFLVNTKLLISGGLEQAVLLARSWDLHEILESLPRNSNYSDDTNDTSQPHSESVAEQLGKNKQDSLANGLFSLNDRSPDKPVKKPKLKKVPSDGMNRYAFVSESEVLLTTTQGRVLRGEIGVCIRWREVDLLNSWRTDLKSYSIVKGISAINIAFLGTAGGKIFMYQTGTICEFGKVPGKIADIFAMYDDETKLVELLVTTLGSNVATIFKCFYEIRPGLQASQQSKRLVTLPERFIVTSAGKVNRQFLTLGSRLGALAIYDPQKYDTPIYTWDPDVRSDDAITSIVNLSYTTIDSKYFLTTGRNGQYCIFSLTYPNTFINLVHQATPPFGPMIEDAWLSGGDLFLYGFKSKNFIVWNETKQYEISSVECGGAHRSYAYSPRRSSGGAGYFIYTKASKLHLHSQIKPSHQIIKLGGHGREIKACAVSEDGLIATGAEDTAIRIWSYDIQFDCLAVMKKHTTGIQHLQWHGSNYLFSSGGNEEFFVWAVKSIPGFGIGVVCEASCPNQSEEKDLRIMSFDTSEVNRSDPQDDSNLLISLAYSDSTIRIYTYSKKEGFQLVAEGRYTTCCLTQLRHLEFRGQDIYLLTAATDGHLTIWKTRITGNGFNASCYGTCEVSGSCAELIKIVANPNLSLISRKSDLLVNHSNRSNDSDFDRPNKLSILSTHRVHQSSVKSLDISRSNSQIVVATGGDDNALAITMYDKMEAMPKSTVLGSAHAAAITGLRLVPISSIGNDLDELRIVTSSNDQRVKEWKAVFRSGLNDSDETIRSFLNRQGSMTDSIRITKIGDVFTSIADVGDLTALKDGATGCKRVRVLVVGNGMGVYEVSRVYS